MGKPPPIILPRQMRSGSIPKKSDVSIAKNYLHEDELNVLNRIVTAYLEFAELQAIDQNPMYMKDWIERLDDFIKMSRREILEHSGTISHKEALEKAELEYEKFRQNQLGVPTTVEKHFIKAVENVKNIDKEKKS